jgi:hypothetical protein
MQLVADGKKEQGGTEALWNLELPKRVHHRLHPLRIRCHREDAKRFPPEVSFMLPRSFGREVGAHFALEARLPKVRTHYRHGAAIDLDHKALAQTIGNPETKYEIRYEPDLVNR